MHRLQHFVRSAFAVLAMLSRSAQCAFAVCNEGHVLRALTLE